MHLSGNRSVIVCLLLLVAVSYANVMGNNFTNWDDEHLIVKNGGIRSFNPLFVLENFHLTYPPLTVFSHCADYFFWGLNPVGYHLSDLLIYCGAIIAFFHLCARATGSRYAAFAAAALFAVHPLHVESVAWLSSRKDGLSIFFYLLAFLAYCRSGGGAKKNMLVMSVLLYFFALWSKPITVTLPLALVAYDRLVDPRRPTLAASLKGKLPYALPIIVTAAAAVALDPHNEMGFRYPAGGLYRTFLMMIGVLADYPRMLIFPVGLSPFYLVKVPRAFTESGVLLSASLLAACAAGAMAEVKRRPLVTFCFFWAVISLLPVMQIVPINVVKADRYLYIPSAAFCLFLGAVLSSSPARVRARGAVIALLAVLTAYTAVTIRMNTVWRSSETLWRYVRARDESNADAANNLGIALMREGRFREAEESLNRALSLRPDFASAHNNLANLYLRTGRYGDARAELEKATALTKDIVYSANVYITAGLVYEKQGEYGRAVEAFTRARELQPAYLDDSRLREHIARCREKISGVE